MSELFTSIDIQVYISGAWVSLWTDVLHNPAPRCSRGIMSNGPLDLLADTGRLEFSLRNDASNDAGLIGFYSPGHANCLSGWTTGLPVRLSFTYQGFTRYVWYGRIEPDGITVTPLALGSRDVQVTCYDYMGQAAYHRLSGLTRQTNINIEDAFNLILANMPTQPLAKSVSHTLPNPIPYLFDNLSPETTALSEMNKLTQNHALSRIFIQGDATGGETLTLATGSGYSPVIPNVTTTYKLLMETGDHLLQEDGSYLLLDDTETLTISEADIMTGSEFSYGTNVYNYITITDYPRKVDAAATTVLYTLESEQSLAPGASVSFFGTYRDPNSNTKVNGTAMVAPVASTDYKAFAVSGGTGTDLTANMSVTAEYFAADVKFTVTNTGGTLFYFGGPSPQLFQCRGKGIYLFDSARVVASDTTSISQFGVRALTYDWKYAYTGVATQTFANALLAAYKDPFTQADTLKLFANRDAKNMMAFMFWLPRWAVTVTESVTGFNAQTFWQGISFEIREGKYVYWDVTTAKL